MFLPAATIIEVQVGTDALPCNGSNLCSAGCICEQALCCFTIIHYLLRNMNDDRMYIDGGGSPQSGDLPGSNMQIQFCVAVELAMHDERHEISLDN